MDSKNGTYGEIVVGSKRGDGLASLCNRSDIRTIVEIGTLDGTGSTKIIIDSMRKRESYNGLAFFTVEANAEAYRLALSNNLSAPAFVRFLHGNLLTEDSPLLLMNLSENESRWFSNDSQFRFGAPNVLDVLPETIDLLVLDGGEFTSLNDYLVLRSRARIIYLDDTRVRKNRLAKKTAMEDGFHIVIDINDGNGAAVLERSRLRGIEGVEIKESDLALLERNKQVCSWVPNYGTVAALARSVNAKTVAEIGVAYGYHAEHLCEQLLEIRYFGVDPYLANYDLNDSFCADVTRLFGDIDPQVSMDRLFAAVQMKLNRYRWRSQMIRRKSWEAADQFPDGYFDLVYVDGDHTYAGVTKDLTAWLPKVREGGLLCGDDIGWPDVHRALQDFFGTRMQQVVIYTQTDREGSPVWVLKV